jgi:hypothetical protein
MPTSATEFSANGGCACGDVRFRLKSTPLFVHACHCSLCQRQSGSAFALNAMIEADNIVLVSGQLEETVVPTASGKGQKVSRCPSCRVAVWSIYNGASDLFRFARVGALDEPDKCPPDIHIYTSSKQAWVALPTEAVSVPEYYSASDYWPSESLARRKIAVNGQK